MGAAGTLQVVEDARLTRKIADQMWGVSTDPAIIFGGDSPIVRKIGKLPLLPAKLVLVSPAGKELASSIPEEVAHLARIEDRQLAQAILVTTDDSAGFGSYSGLRTQLFQVADGTITPVLAIDEKAKSSPVILSNTLKARWRIATRNGLQQILQIRCDPDFEHDKPDMKDMPFVISYIVFRYADGAWHRSERQEPGFWESDRDFPESRFP
jgi:hypothetical protein